MRQADFFISFTARDKSWADWIASTLNNQGYSVVYQPWHFRPGSSFVLQMNEGARCRATIAVVSEDYLSSAYCQAEWAAAFAQDPTGVHRKLIPVRIAPCNVAATLLGAIVHIDLTNATGADAAKQQLLKGIDDVTPSERPEYPMPLASSAPFPGGNAPGVQERHERHAQVGSTLPPPGLRIHASGALVAPALRAWRMRPDDALALDLILDSGDERIGQEHAVELSERLGQHFFTCLTLPRDCLWVNLSPVEGDRTMADPLMGTPLGFDLLSQDYILKQVVSTLVYPESEPGRSYFSELHRQLENSLNQESVNTIAKVWAVPGAAEIRGNAGVAALESSRLAVLTAHDYDVASNGGAQDAVQPGSARDVGLSREHEITLATFKRLVLPHVEKDLNEGANFVVLRQAYSAMLLALWYRETLRRSLPAGTNGILGAGQVRSAELRDATGQIYRRYLESYRMGVFNYIREDLTAEGVLPRKYFSGGFTAVNALASVGSITADRVTVRSSSRLGKGALFWVRLVIEHGEASDPGTSAIAPEYPGGVDLGDLRTFDAQLEIERSCSSLTFTAAAVERVLQASKATLAPRVAWVLPLKGDAVELGAHTALEERVVPW